MKNGEFNFSDLYVVVTSIGLDPDVVYTSKAGAEHAKKEREQKWIEWNISGATASIITLEKYIEYVKEDIEDKIYRCLH